jgi:hypothetical protein
MTYTHIYTYIPHIYTHIYHTYIHIYTYDICMTYVHRYVQTYVCTYFTYVCRHWNAVPLHQDIFCSSLTISVMNDGKNMFDHMTACVLIQLFFSNKSWLQEVLSGWLWRLNKCPEWLNVDLVHWRLYWQFFNAKSSSFRLFALKLSEAWKW